MIKDTLQKRYFDWMCDIVCGSDEYRTVSYVKLLTFLHDTEFTYIESLDENRAQGGIDFRYRFGYENNYSSSIIARHLDDRPCSVLEMMVAMAFRVEEEIMDDFTYGDRTGQWFWNMIVNLGLGNMCDSVFDEEKAHDIITRFLNREYDYDGKGGLFTVANSEYDMRGVDIWTQFMWYLNDVIDETK